MTTELTYDVDAGELEVGQTVFAFDKEAGEYRETEITELEDAGLYTRILVEDDAANFSPSGYTVSHFDFEKGDWAYLALPENVEEVADAFADYTGTDIEIIESDDGEDGSELVTDGGEDVSPVEEIESRDDLEPVQWASELTPGDTIVLIYQGGIHEETVIKTDGDRFHTAEGNAQYGQIRPKEGGKFGASHSGGALVWREIGEQDTETTINSLLKYGLSPAEAWYYYGVEIKGFSQSEWGRRTGKDQSTISKGIERAKNKLERTQGTATERSVGS